MNTPTKKARPGWYRKLARPVQLIVDERLNAEGFADDPDEWIAGVLTTARHSPQGYVLRLSMRREVVKALNAEATASADLFGALPEG